MRRFLKSGFQFAGYGLLACLLLSFAGRYLPLGDSLAVFRIPMLVALIPVFFIYSKPWIRFGIIAVGLFVIVSDAVDRHSFEPPQVGTYRIYQKNISPWIQNAQPLIEDIVSSEADFVTLQELYSHNAYILKQLETTYPYQHWCKTTGMAILSQTALTDRRPFCENGVALVEIQTSRGKIWLGSAHLAWPWPSGQGSQVNQLIPLLRSLDQPTILSGDFNAVPWSATVAKLEHAINGHRVGPFQPTFDLFPMFSITIDHIIAGNGHYSQQVRPMLGSDHKGLIADVEPTIQ